MGTIRQLILTQAALGGVIILAIFAVSLGGIYQLTEAERREVSQGMGMLIGSFQLERMLGTEKDAYRSYLLQDRALAQARLQQQKREFLEQVDALVTLMDDPARETPILQDIRALHGQYVARMLQGIAEPTGGQAPHDRVDPQSLAPVFRQLQQRISDLIAQQYTDLDAHHRKVQATEWLSGGVLLGGVGVSIALLLWISQRLVHRVLVPLADLATAAERLGGGDLTVKVPFRRTDELGTVARAFNEMASQLELRDAQLQQADELDRIKRQFISAVSHELRTPMTSIMGYAEFLQDEIGGALSPENRTFVEQIMVGSHRLSRIVDDLLDFARMEAGTFRLVCEHEDLCQVLREGVDSLRPQLQEAALSLVSDLAACPLDVVMDAKRIGQVVLNLVGNAIKFTPPGGAIHVTVAYRDLDLARVEVVDTGIGIALEHLPRIFEKFYQADMSNTRHQSGTGLGLAIAKALIEAHGGTLGVESTVGEGSTFWFTLPRSGPPGCTVLPEAPTEAGRSRAE